MSTEESDQWHQLAVVASALGEEVANLRVAEEKQAKEFKALRVEVEKKNYRTTIKLRVMVSLLVVDLALSGVVFYGLAQIRHIVNDAFCPLLAVFIGSYDPESRPAGKGRIAYEDAFVQIRHIYGPVLKCPQIVVPPRTDMTPPR